MHISAGALDGNPQAAAGIGVARTVFEEIDHDLAQPVRIAVDENRRQALERRVHGKCTGRKPFAERP